MGRQFTYPVDSKSCFDRRSRHSEFLLTGFVVCPNGVRLVGGSGYGRSGEKYSYYKHSKKCSCHFSSVPAKEVEKIVLTVLKEVATSPETLAALVSEANDDFKKVQPDYKKVLFAAQRRMAGVSSHLNQATS